MNKTINQYINQLHLDPNREAAVRKLIQSVSQSSGGSNGGNSGGSNTPEPEFVDLGLPSGTLWCSCNLGASSPEEVGNLYMWGDDKPWHLEHDDANHTTKFVNDDGIIIENGQGYGWEYYKHCTLNKGGRRLKFLKYNSKADWGNVDYATELSQLDDIAYQFNKEWRTPSFKELNELLMFVDGQKVSERNGLYLYKLTSRINNNYIYVYNGPSNVTWANTLADPAYNDGYDCRTAMAFGIDNYNNYPFLGGSYSYGIWFRCFPTFIRPVKYGNISNKSIINVQLVDTDNCVVLFSKLAQGALTKTPVFDLNRDTFINNLMTYDNGIIRGDITTANYKIKIEATIDKITLTEE